MKKQYFLAALYLCMGISACTLTTSKPETSTLVVIEETDSFWKDYFIGNIVFEDKAPQSEGSHIYHNLIPNAEHTSGKQARTAPNTLYFSPEDSIAPVYNLHYSLERIVMVFLPKAVKMVKFLSFTVHVI